MRSFAVNHAVVSMLRTLDPDRSGSISFEQFVTMASARAAPGGSGSPQADRLGMSAAPPSPVSSGFAPTASMDEAPDPKVEEFLKILEEYRCVRAAGSCLRVALREDSNRHLSPHRHVACRVIMGGLCSATSHHPLTHSLTLSYSTCKRLQLQMRIRGQLRRGCARDGPAGQPS